MLDDDALRLKLRLLTTTQKVLRVASVRTDVQKHRYEQTWHHRPMPRNWVATVGMWGGTYPQEEIMKVAKVEYNTFKRFRAIHDLRTPRPPRSKKHGPVLVASWELAVAVCVNFRSCTSKVQEDHVAAARSCGILPIEAFLYVEGMLSLAKNLGLADLSELSSPANRGVVQEVWADYQGHIDRIMRSAYARGDDEEAVHEVHGRESPEGS